MSRKSRRFGNSPLRPVKHIEVTVKNKKLRLVLIVLLLALGTTLIASGVVSCLSTEPGWQQIQATARVDESCASEFVFVYLLGENGRDPKMEQRQLTQLYTQATTDAFQIFHEEREFDQLHNVAWLNQHPNEEAEVPKALYDAFATLEKHGNRSLYLAPLYREYVGMFLSDSDSVAQVYDPGASEEQNHYFEEVLHFTSDEDAVKLMLLGENRVKLVVADAYLQFAAENEIASFIDFYWMKNAFIADYLAQRLLDGGYTNGALSSFDGFGRNLDQTQRSYQLNVFDRVGDDIYMAGSLQYKEAGASVALRNYPTSEQAVHLYYQWEDGRYTSCHIDPEDGRSKSAVNDLLGYSRSHNCAEILMRMCPVYIADSLDTQDLKRLRSQGVETAYCQDRVLYTTDVFVQVSQLYERDGVQYTWQRIS